MKRNNSHIQKKMDKTNEYTLITGGAGGSDTFWADEALKWEVNVTIMSFGSHSIPKNAHRVILSPRQLLSADKHVTKANIKLKRTFPTKNTYTDNLLRRDYFQVSDTGGVFAISTISSCKKSVAGGTAWAVQMAIDAHVTMIYVFDYIKEKWFRYNWSTEKFTQCKTPVLTKKFTGIGSRKAPDKVKEVITDVFRKTFAPEPTVHKPTEEHGPSTSTD